MSDHPGDYIYFDNAATTALDHAVRDAMIQAMDEVYGNPSSVHAPGRKAKVRIEEARRNIARHFRADQSEVAFMSTGTEAIVTALHGAVETLGVRRVITARTEHPAVLETLNHLEKDKGIKVEFVRLGNDGVHDLGDLRRMLKAQGKTMVCLMYANNVIGTLLPVKEVGDLCRGYDALFACDTVQAIGKYPISFRDLGIHIAASSAHKYHGPKGVGFLYLDKTLKVPAILRGGGQERGLRSGTENTYGIIGMERALETAYDKLHAHRSHIAGLKEYAVQVFRHAADKIEFIAGSDSGGLYNLFYAGFPGLANAGNLQFHLDMKGIGVSTGSACSSGASKPSYVMEAIGASALASKSIRFSFSKFNTKEEVDRCAEVLKDYLSAK